MGNRYDTIDEISKFNPNHDEKGRFSTRDRASFFTIQTKDPNKQHWADMAIAREKEYDKNKKKPAATKPAVEAKPTAQSGPKGIGNQETAGHANVNLHTAKERADYVKDQLGCSQSEANRLSGSVNKFTGSSYSAIRRAQTSKDGDPDLKKVADNLEEYIEKAPKWGSNNGPLFRGIRLSEADAAKLIKQAQDGEALDQRGTASWSSNQGVAKSFAAGGKVPVVFVNAGGTKCGTAIKALSEFESEDEILTSAKQRVRATNVRQANINGKNGYIIEVEEIAP